MVEFRPPVCSRWGRRQLGVMAASAACAADRPLQGAEVVTSSPTLELLLRSTADSAGQRTRVTVKKYWDDINKKILKKTLTHRCLWRHVKSRLHHRGRRYFSQTDSRSKHWRRTSAVKPLVDRWGAYTSTCHSSVDELFIKALLTFCSSNSIVGATADKYSGRDKFRTKEQKNPEPVSLY